MRRYRSFYLRHRRLRRFLPAWGVYVRPAARLADTRIELWIGGAPVLGPLTLEQLALIIRYGGYRPGGDLLSDVIGAPVQLRVWAP